MSSEISRRGVLQGALATAPLVYGNAAYAIESVAQGQGPMTSSYIGSATSRVDGRAKVTGAAKYAGEFNQKGLAFGSVITSTIPKGRIKLIDTSRAMRVAGVLDVLTHAKRPRMSDTDAGYRDLVAPEGGSPFRPLYDDKIVFNDQPVALVLAEDWETANFAASLVRIEYDEAPFLSDLEKQRGKAFVVAKPEKPRGNADAAAAAAAVRHEAEYYVPMEFHNPMELFAATVVPESGGKLTVYDKTQGVPNVHLYVCSVFGLKPEDVRVISPYVGGGFGAGLRPQYEVVLAVLGAQALQRPVRLVLTRHQMYGLGYRPASIERLALGASEEGTLDAMKHEAIAVTSQFEDFSRNDSAWGGLLYKCANTKFEHKLVRLDFPTSSDMRAPGAATGVYALECAMDELAIALKIDPLDLRLRCYSSIDQNENIPYTSKQLRECYRQGGEAFGWNRRSPQPRSMRDGSDLVGWGMATGIWEALEMSCAARIVLTANGHADVSCAASDLGTGTYTIMAQVAADMIGLPIENITVKIGDSTLPMAPPVAGGSWTAASVSNAIAVTAAEVRKQLLHFARAIPNSPLAAAKYEDVVFANGAIVDRREPARTVSYADAMRQGGVDRVEAEKTNEVKPDPTHARNTHSAIFAEVKVDEQLGVVRVTRVVNAVAGGRILNAKTAHSQIMGSVVWGIGMALHEEALVDHKFGRIMNADIAEYHVPVNADIHDIKVIFVDEPDDLVNPMGIKGLGEIGIVGVAAAIANAVYHATGVRVRDLPITLDKLQRKPA